MTITWSLLERESNSVRGVTTALTESAPSSGANDGIDLAGVRSICITLDAPSGQTFDGTGSLLAYRQGRFTKEWKPASEFDLDLTDINGKSGYSFAPIAVDHPSGRVAFIPSGVGVSGGTALTITIEAN